MDEFDRLLYQSSVPAPPDLPEPPKPWKRSMGFICWGLAFISITLNFLSLDLILPAVGTALLWLGLRPLRQENGGFRFAYLCATAYALLHMTTIVLLATPLDQFLTSLRNAAWHTTSGSVSLHLVLLACLLQFLLTLAVGGLWQGLKGVFVRVGQSPRTAAAGGLVVFEALLLPMALIGLEGWLLVGPVLLVWLLLIFNLRTISASLDEVGYALSPAPVRLSAAPAFGLWLGVPLLAILLLPLLFSRLPVNSQTEVRVPGGDLPLREELLELGFPEDILSRLTDDEVSRFDGAYGLTVKGYPLSSGDFPDGIPGTVVLEVPVQDARYGFHVVYLACLFWEAEEAGGYMEGIKITSDHHGVTVRTTCPQGTLNWTDGGVLHTAPIRFRFRSDGSWPPSYFADFSLPKTAGGRMEGYVFWEAMPTFPEPQILFNYSLSAVHRLSPWQYPYTLPSDVLLANRFGPEWRSRCWIYTGQLAPEGEYDSAGY